MRPLWYLPVVPCLLLTMSCASAYRCPGAAGLKGLDPGDVSGVLSRSGVPAPNVNHTKLSTIDLLGGEVLAFRLLVVDRVPPSEIVGVTIEGGSPVITMVDNQARIESLESLLSCYPFVEAFEDRSEDIARAIVILSVNTSPEHGVLLRASGDIPLTIERSDVLRDLRRSGLSEAEISESLLRPVADLDIERPKRSDDTLVFYSWSYYGGEVVRWEIRRSGRRLEVSSRVLARAAGSYDLRM